MGIEIDVSSLMLLGTIDWVTDSVTIKGAGAILTKADVLSGMAPIPIPPPNTGDACPCAGPGGDVECMVTPGQHTINGTSDSNKMVTMGSMYTQKDGANGKICQPMMAMSAQSVLNPTPVLTTADAAMIMGMLNGAGAM